MQQQNQKLADAEFPAIRGSNAKKLTVTKKGDRVKKGNKKSNNKRKNGDNRNSTSNTGSGVPSSNSVETRNAPVLEQRADNRSLKFVQPSTQDDVTTNFNCSKPETVSEPQDNFVVRQQGEVVNIIAPEVYEAPPVKPQPELVMHDVDGPMLTPQYDLSKKATDFKSLKIDFKSSPGTKDFSALNIDIDPNQMEKFKKKVTKKINRLHKKLDEVNAENYQLRNNNDGVKGWDNTPYYYQYYESNPSTFALTKDLVVLKAKMPVSLALLIEEHIHLSLTAMNCSNVIFHVMKDKLVKEVCSKKTGLKLEFILHIKRLWYWYQIKMTTQSAPLERAAEHAVLQRQEAMRSLNNPVGFSVQQRFLSDINARTGVVTMFTNYLNSYYLWFVKFISEWINVFSYIFEGVEKVNPVVPINPVSEQKKTYHGSHVYAIIWFFPTLSAYLEEIIKCFPGTSYFVGVIDSIVNVSPAQFNFHTTSTLLHPGFAGFRQRLTSHLALNAATPHPSFFWVGLGMLTLVRLVNVWMNSSMLSTLFYQLTILMVMSTLTILSLLVSRYLYYHPIVLRSCLIGLVIVIILIAALISTHILEVSVCSMAYQACASPPILAIILWRLSFLGFLESSVHYLIMTFFISSNPYYQILYLILVLTKKHGLLDVYRVRRN